MKIGEWILLSSLVVASPAALAQNHEPGMGFVHIQPADVKYESDPDFPGLGYAVLSGDPDESGTYAIRLKIPPGSFQWIRPEKRHRMVRRAYALIQ